MALPFSRRISRRSGSQVVRAAVESLEIRALLASVPSGFADAQIATGLTSPTAIDVAPDGRVFLAQQDGTIRVVQNDQMLSTPFANLSSAVDSSNERGMLGLTVDPDFLSNHYLYVYYTAKSPTSHNRISRLVANGNVLQAGSETVLVDFPSIGGAIWHMGGAIHFGPDGKLYVGVGDHQQSAQAQSLSSVFGKILRFNPDGSIPTDDPFYASTTGVNRAIYSYGLRNPFTFSIQASTGKMFVNDVGESSWEEVNQAAPGANFGWPTTEGDFTQTSFPNFTRPIYTYSHSVGQCVAGALFYAPPNPTFPAQYYNQFFFVDFSAGFMRTMDPVTHVVSGFATGLNFPTDAHVAPTGAIYYLQRGMNTGDPITGSGSLRKLDYANANSSPTIVEQPGDQSGTVGQQVTFGVSALGSAPLSYQWKRNNQDVAGAINSTYTRTIVAGDDNAVFTCVVSNPFGQKTSSGGKLILLPGTAPAPTINLPIAGAKWNAGDTVNFTGSAVDLDDGALPASALTWEVDYITGNVSRPLFPATSGIAGASVVVPNTSPYLSTTVALRLILTARDSVGAVTTVSRDLLPNVATATFTTNISGLGITLDGSPHAAPYVVDGVVGLMRTLMAPATQILNGTTYQFIAWSDGGGATHDLAFPATNSIFTATYAATAAPIYLSSLTPTTTTNGYGPYEKDRSNGEQGATDGKAITLAGITYAKGLGVHALSDLSFNLAKNYARYQAKIGIDDEVGNNGSVLFQIYLDGTKVFDSGAITGASATQNVDIDVSNKTTLRLVVDPNGATSYDHADWADAKLISAGVTSPPPNGLFYPPVGYATATHAHGVTTADFNGDGRLDLAVANAGSNSVTVLFGNGNATFGSATSYAVGAEPKSVFAKDLNGDGKIDLITASQASNTMTVFINKGDGTFNAGVAYASPAGSHEAFAGDLNGDTKPDIAVVGWGASVARIFINNGDGTFAVGADYTVGSEPHSIVGLDIDGDGDLDLATANHGGSNVGILKNNGNGTFQSVVQIAVGSGPHSIRTADLNADGRMDLVTANEYSDNTTVLLGNGNGTFAPAVAYSTGVGSVPKGVGIGDLNNDGKLDIIIADSGGNYPDGDNIAGKKLSVLLGNGTGTFGTVTLYDAGHTPFGVALGDFDGDGDLDVASANWHSDNVTILKNGTIDTTPPPPNNPPVANNDSAATSAGTAVQIAVLSNDIDTDGSVVASSVNITTAPTNGSAIVDAASGKIIYTPAQGFVGVDSFFYTVKDDDGATSNIAKVTVNVTSQQQQTIVYLSDLSPTAATNGWGSYEKDRSNGEQGVGDGKAITLGGVTFAKGLGVHASSDISYNLAGQYSHFDAKVGLDDEVGNSGSAIFQVYVDGVKVFDSGVISGASATQTISLDVTNKTTLRLVLNPNGTINSDHGDWADAKLTNGQGVPDTTAPSAPSNLRSSGKTSTSITLAWNASTDDVGVVGYEIYRNNVKVGTSSTLAFTDNGLSPNTTYAYTVKAYDAATNGSDPSAPISVTTNVQSSSTYLSDLTPTSATNGWGNYEKDRSNGETGANDGKTITLNGVTYTKGLGVHAASDLRYNLSGQWTTFSAAIGLDDEVGNGGSVIFRVYADGLLIYDSGVMTGATATKLLSLNVAGKSELRLVVDSNGATTSDHADWADAKVS